MTNQKRNGFDITTYALIVMVVSLIIIGLSEFVFKGKNIPVIQNSSKNIEMIQNLPDNLSVYSQIEEYKDVIQNKTLNKTKLYLEFYSGFKKLVKERYENNESKALIKCNLKPEDSPIYVILKDDAGNLICEKINTPKNDTEDFCSTYYLDDIKALLSEILDNNTILFKVHCANKSLFPSYAFIYKINESKFGG